MKIYIDGSSGTTGLALESRLQELEGITLLKIKDELRKDIPTRKSLLNEADVVFLCLPDEAAKEAVTLIENPHTVVIDASTAHRTSEGWTYGFPELSAEHLEAVKTAKRISVPGCHASGFAAMVYPLVAGGFIHKSEILSCQSLTGYSGGGKELIAQYEQGNPAPALLYGLDLNHKHLPEMTAVCGLDQPPVFMPVIVPTYKGMITTIPLAQPAQKIWSYLKNYYEDSANIKVQPLGATHALPIENDLGAGEMELHVFGHDDHCIIGARFDNLGKGSSGAALECLKLKLQAS